MASTQPLLQFKAGRAFRTGETNTVVPQPERGLIILQEHDGLKHFCYKNLVTNELDDLIIFPGDATFSPVPGVARVHVLKFASSGRREFFWHQDVDSSKDQERADLVNEIIGAQLEEEEESNAMQTEGSSSANAPAPASSVPSAFETPAPASRQLPSTFSPPSAPSQLTSSAAQLSQLSAILSGLSSTGASSSSFSRGFNSTPSYILPDVLSAPSVLPLVRTLSPTQLSQLSSFLPAGVTPVRAITSIEFRRSVASLDRALRTGALGPLVRGLGLGEESALGVEAFLEGVEAQAHKEKGKESEGGERMEE